MIISTPPKGTSGLTFAELGLLIYMLDNVDSDGNFQQHLNTIAHAGGSTIPTVHRWQLSLITKGFCTVVRKSRKDANGYQIPPILKPKLCTSVEQAFEHFVEQVQTPDNKAQTPSHEASKKHSVEREKPIPFGMLEALPIEERKNSTVKSVDSRTATCSTTTCMPVEQAQVRDTQPVSPKSSTLPPYRIGCRYPEAGIDYTRAPYCPFCGGEDKVDWFTQKGTVQFFETCGKDSCKSERDEMQRTGESLKDEGWTKAAARRRREFERHDELQAKREENAQNPLLYDDNGRYRSGQSYPDADGSFDDELVPDCPFCLDPCWISNPETGDRFTVNFTCGNPACEEARAKVLRGQKEFDERVSEDETLTTKEEAAL